MYCTFLNIEIGHWYSGMRFRFRFRSISRWKGGLLHHYVGVCVYKGRSANERAIERQERNIYVPTFVQDAPYRTQALCMSALLTMEAVSVAMSMSSRVTLRACLPTFGFTS